MGRKRNKAKKLSITKESIFRKTHDLPPELIHFSSKKRNLLYYTTSPGTTKSWLTTTTARWCITAAELHQWTQLYQLNDASSNSPPPCYPHNHFLSDSDVAALGRNPNPAASYWCIMKEVGASFRIHPTSTVVACPNNNFVRPRAVLVKSGRVSSSTLMVLYVDCNSKYVWIRHECSTVDPFDIKRKWLKFTSVVRFKGKFYALSLQGTLVVMQNVDSCLRVTGMGRSRVVPSVISRFFKEYLVEVDGDILLVFLIFKKWLGVVDEVEVYRLGFDELEWIKVERLQGKTLFLDRCCFWVNSTDIGCWDSCVYFTHGSDNYLWSIYDMESRCISPA